MVRRIICAIAAVAALAVSGTAFASESHPKAHHARILHAGLSTTAPRSTGSSDQSTATSDPAGPNDQSNGPDPAGAGETRTAGEQASSEQMASDGPGGHADEPANANADHQFQGEE